MTISMIFSRGEVLTIEPLLVSTHPNKEVLNFTNICLLSMATVTKVIAISVRPTIVVHFTQVLKVRNLLEFDLQNNLLFLGPFGYSASALLAIRYGSDFRR